MARNKKVAHMTTGGRPPKRSRGPKVKTTWSEEEEGDKQFAEYALLNDEVDNYFKTLPQPTAACRHPFPTFLQERIARSPGDVVYGGDSQNIACRG